MIKFSIWRLLLGMFLLASASTGYSQNWQVEEGLTSPAVIEKLKAKYPKIDDANQLQSLLRDMSRLEPLYELIADQRGEEWLIHGIRAKRIDEIHFQLLTRMFRQPLEALATSYLQQVDSPEIREKLHSTIARLLFEHGYLQPKITLSTAPSGEHGIKYFYKIDYGSPCLISEVSFSFKLPNSIRFPIVVGDVCDVTEAQSTLADLEDKIQDLGYNQARFEQPRFKYNSTGNTAKLYIEANIGQKIKYQIIDTEKRFFFTDLFSSDELNSIDPTIVSPEAMAADLAQRYRNRGYDDVRVEPAIVEKISEDEVLYKFNVNAGPLYELTNIQFQGAKQYTQEQLLDLMGLSSLWQTSTPLKMESIQQGGNSIKAKYRADGFWNAVVRDPKISKNRETGQAQMVILIDEGEQYKLSHVRFAGNKFFSTEKVLKMLNAKTGLPLDQAKLVDFEKKLKNAYAAQGFIYSAVDIKLEFLPGVRTLLTTVNVTIDEGPRVKIGDIQIHGLVMTKQYVVTRELLFETGEWYDPEAIDASRRALLALGLFRSVQISAADRNALAEKSPWLDILVEVTEAKPGKVSFGPGWSLLRGNRYGAEASYNNIVGTGRQLFGRARFSEESSQEAIGPKTLVGRSLSLGYLEPYLIGLPIDGTASVTNSARADEKWLLTSSGEIALSHRLRALLVGSEVGTFYGQKINREESAGEEKLGYLQVLGGDVRIGRVGWRFKIDRRNDLSWPSSGFIVNTEYSIARFGLGGDLAFDGWKLGASQYFRLRRNWVLALGANFASFYNIERRGDDADVLPVSETLHVGGSDSVRGYRERSLGPRVDFDSFDDNGLKTRDHEITGGSNSAVYKAEVRYQIIENSFAVTGFVDAGNTFFSRHEIERFKRAEAKNNAQERGKGAVNEAEGKVDGRSSRQETEISDNADYNFEELAKNPDYIWTKNYTAYGFALNYLTPLGSINLAYGLPWKRCVSAAGPCYERGKHEKYWILDGVIHINVGANF